MKMTKCDVAGFVRSYLFVTDSDCESYTGMSDSEDQEESEAWTVASVRLIIFLHLKEGVS